MLDDAYDDSVSSASTLRDTMRAKERAAGALVAGGSIANISRNNASHSHAFGRGNITTLEIAKAWRELIDLFDVVSASSDYSSATDEEKKAEMMRRLIPVKEFFKDYTCLAP